MVSIWLGVVRAELYLTQLETRTRKDLCYS